MLLILLTAAAAARVLGEQDPAALLASVQPGWILAALCCAVGGQLLHGARVLVLLPPGAGPRPPLLRLCLLYLASIVLNLSFPGPAGELAAAWAVRDRHGTAATAVLAASLHGRFAGLLTGSLALLLSLPLVALDPALAPYLRVGGLLVGLGGGALALLSLRPRLLVLVSAATAGRLAGLPGLPGRLFGRLHATVVDFSGHLASVVTRPLAYVQAMGWSLVMLLAFVATTLCAGQAVGAMPALAGAVLAVTSSQLTSIAAVVIPGGLGAFELAFAGSLVGAGGLTPAAAGAATLGIRLVQVLVLVPGCLAFVGFARELVAARARAVA